jgi:hypothetical protein
MKLAAIASLAVIAAVGLPNEGGGPAQPATKSTLGMSSAEFVATETIELANDFAYLGAHRRDIVRLLLPEIIASYVALGEAEMLLPPQALLFSPL